MIQSSIMMEGDSQISIVTLNRPTVYNAVTYDVLLALERFVTELENDPPRVVILTGAKPGFCSGIDLKESREATSEFARKRATLMHNVLHRLRNIPSPLIAAVDGVAAGLGCELAISGDLRIASPSSRFSYPEPKVAVPSPTFHLSRLIGMARTQDVLLTARWIDAGEALDWGLITRSAGDPLAAATELAGELLALSPISLAKTKENLAISISGGEVPAMHHHIQHVAAAAGTRDRIEALTAFAEKRQPRFEGR
ncbi:short-chain-enoyl-CoA hydratase [soil metagenome]